MTCLTLKAIKDNIRLPDSIIVAYPPYRIQYQPSPSRILSLMDPLLPIGVLRTCIQAYTGNIKVDKSLQGIHYFNYHDDEYNAFDVDIGERDQIYNKNKPTRSLSEPNLLLKSRLPLKQGFEADSADDESFYSDFPCSDTESLIYEEEQSDLSLSNKNMHHTNHLFVRNGTNGNLSVNSMNESASSSYFTSLTSRVSSSVQNFRSGMTAYMYGSEGQSNIKHDQKVHRRRTSRNKVAKTENNQSFDELKEQSCIDAIAKEVKTVSSSTEKCPLDTTVVDCGDSSNGVQKPIQFSICKQCLHRADHCVCAADSCCQRRLENHRKDQYRSSHHHVTNTYHSRMRLSSLSNGYTITDEQVNKLRSKSVSTHSGGGSEHCSSPKRSLAKSLEDLKLILKHYDDLTPPYSPKLNVGRAVYDKSSEMCVILTPEEESKFKLAENRFLSNVGTDPLVSPYLASDELLRKFPPITIVVCFSYFFIFFLILQNICLYVPVVYLRNKYVVTQIRLPPIEILMYMKSASQ